MYLGRVIGNLQATFVCEGLEGMKLQWVELQRSDGSAIGSTLVACDATQAAGPGDRVLLVDSREAVIPLPVDSAPVDATIVAIVDEVHVS